MSESIRVNFGRPIPLFPLPETVLLPHALLPLHIFEPRYRQMVSEVLDQSGQIAIATFEGTARDAARSSSPKMRPIVCIGQILQHESLPDGRYNVLLRGICRARLTAIQEPDEVRLYRTGTMEPIERLEGEPPKLPGLRDAFRDVLLDDSMDRIRGIQTIREWIERNEDEVPTHALIELIGFALIHDVDRKYGLLAEASADKRGRLVTSELHQLHSLIRRGLAQRPEEWPKGMSWN
jgi:Lon protease-like protein